jgi:2-keto-4-pentenoate hydratase/2-oxohepta-3-ene-1,7-dioic acid hydratase in catechol pathway
VQRIELANLAGRAQLVREGRLIDVQRRSSNALSADPHTLLADWQAFCDWAADQHASEQDPELDPARLSPCVPSPSQVFAIGLNYRDHATEAGLPLPQQPMVFTKFPSCLAGPRAEIPLTGERVDWEVELVVVIGSGGRDLAASQALRHVAGYCVGQDISDRRRQFADSPAQFSLGKSSPAFGPIGPTLVALQSIAQPLDLALTCAINGERIQDSRTSQMVFDVAQLVSYLSRYCCLRPGDLIFTGTPAGVGSVRSPRRYLAAGDVIRSEIEALGVLENRCVPL